MRVIPRRYRFAIARVAAETLRPLVRRSGRFREQLRFRMDTDREVALHHALTAMTISGTPFDPPLTVVNVDQLNEELMAGRGVFFAGTHMVLMPLVFRHLHDRGIIPFVVTASPAAILGTRAETHAVAPSPESLMQVRGLLRDGAVLTAMLDRAEETDDRRTIEVETSAGKLRIRDTLLRLAMRCNAAIFFISAHIEPRGGISIVLQKADADPVAEFMAFVRRHARG
ncbi:MAG TPA: hypothetical protein VJ276_10420 [Thermoanaerobaculia bacterium]|nr:hypothetical protein [Thermoanaerobaculia bacterium]